MQRIFSVLWILPWDVSIVNCKVCSLKCEMFCVQNSVVHLWQWMNLTRSHLWSLKGLTDQAQSQPQSDGFIKCPMGHGPWAMTLLVTEPLPDGFIRCSMSLHLNEHKHNTNTWQQGNIQWWWKVFVYFSL